MNINKLKIFGARLQPCSRSNQVSIPAFAIVIQVFMSSLAVEAVEQEQEEQEEIDEEEDVTSGGGRGMHVLCVTCTLIISCKPSPFIFIHAS